MSETYCYNADPAEGNFTILNNTCIRDPRLTARAKGMHTYFMSLPSNWKLFKTELVKHFKDGIDSINSAIKELVEFGYVEITEQTRTKSGKFSSKAYGFHAKPIKKNAEDNRNGFAVTVKPSTVEPLTVKPALLTTKKLNTYIQKTDPTNTGFSEKNTNYAQTVSESVFVTTIRKLFCGEYPFDAGFEATVLTFLEKSAIGNTLIEPYLNYVFDRTKKGKVQKSFEGLYHKLALSRSIVRDFKLSQQITSKREDATVQKLQSCPVCGEPANIFANCSNCGFDMQDRGDNAKVFKARQILNWSPEKMAAYEKETKLLLSKIPGGCSELLHNANLREQYDRELAAIDEKFGLKKVED